MAGWNSEWIYLDVETSSSSNFTPIICLFDILVYKASLYENRHMG